ncbi:tripartite tricarboxylate transporter substrate-binding protein [Allostreptomyces psammosilenae]|uniref:Putative tricarboxylic transport membrane protein n=1 Tax=Allostreptomyces psammosilenae TaxID=1892865 RepID=A0A852ZZ41_9ACTN|nr:tripartite tricarboxylate transporter substrate-binding protein [Allostreptomyces psammosilenae]NYI03542.1 putative tricarboxylic transport membrane protein [Allostreptomyces psammosilenae]
MAAREGGRAMEAAARTPSGPRAGRGVSRRTLLTSAVAGGGALALLAAGLRSDDRGLRGLRLMVPNTAGSGYDITARTLAEVLAETGAAPDVQVFNLPGAGGTVALARLFNEAGNGLLGLMMGLGTVGAAYADGSGQARPWLAAATPVARLVEEPEVVVVSADSPYAELSELLESWAAAPATMRVGGSSTPAGPDQLMLMRLADAVGVPRGRVDYVNYDGGELLPAIRRSEVAFAISGVGETLAQVQAGELRALAVTSGRPLPHYPAPTLRQQGLDLVFTNWRGLLAPPGVDARRREALRAAVEVARGSARWRRALERNGWTDAFATGQEFADFLRDQGERVDATLRGSGGALLG